MYPLVRLALFLVALGLIFAVFLGFGFIVGLALKHL